MTTASPTTRPKAKRIAAKPAKPTARAVTKTTRAQKPRSKKAREEVGRLTSLAERFKKGDSEGRRLTWEAAEIAHIVCDKESLESQSAFGKRVNRTQQIISRYVHAERFRQHVDGDHAKWIRTNLSVTEAAQMQKQYNQFSETDKKAISRRRFVERVIEENGNVRKARAALTAELISQRTEKGRAILAASPRDDWNARCHRGCYLDLLKRLEDHSVALVNYDPPYFGYRWKQGKGLYGSSHSATSGLRIDCANVIDEVTDDAALPGAYRKHFNEAFAEMSRVLKPGGLVAVWTRGGHETPRDILEAAESHGMELYVATEWDKADDDEAHGIVMPPTTQTTSDGNARTAQSASGKSTRPRDAAQPENFSEPHAHSSERMVLLKRTEDKIRRADANTLPRATIIRASYIRRALDLFKESHDSEFWSHSMGHLSASTPARSFFQECANDKRTIGDAHQFQKHEEWGLFQLMKYCHPGDVVVDAFGCSASFCIAAEQYGCKWYYAEKNNNNFDWAMTRLKAYFDWAEAR